MGVRELKRFCFALILILFLVGCAGEKEHSGRLEQVLVFPEGESGYGYVNSQNDGLLITFFRNSCGEKGIYWLINGRVESKVKDAIIGVVSLDGTQYAYVKGKKLFINKIQGGIVKTFDVSDWLLSVVWSLDSKYIYIGHVEDDSAIYRINVETGERETITDSFQFSCPVTVNNPQKLYLLQMKDPDAMASDGDISLAP